MQCSVCLSSDDSDHDDNDSDDKGIVLRGHFEEGSTDACRTRPAGVRQRISDAEGAMWGTRSAET